MVMYAAVDTIILLRVGRRFLQRQLFSGLRLAKFNPLLENSPLKDLISVRLWNLSFKTTLFAVVVVV